MISCLPSPRVNNKSLAGSMLIRSVRRQYSTMRQAKGSTRLLGTAAGVPTRGAETAPALSSTDRNYAAAISRVALIGSFSTLHSANRFASRGLT
jgi:hypothetical protein